MYKLIIIDDEEKIASGMAQLFPWQNIGFEVVQVLTSARKALQYIAENPVDVVLTDIEMPDMNGLELSHRLMEYPNIQKIFFSSYSNYEYFRAALQNGVADYLMKPVAYSALLECFEKVKARLDARSAVQETAPKAYYDQIVYDVQQYLKDNYRTGHAGRSRGQGFLESGLSFPRVQGKKRNQLFGAAAQDADGKSM